MKINIKGTGLDLTPPLKEYIAKRLEPLSKFVKRYEEKGEIQMFVEVARTTKHHHKGNVFYAEVTLELPKKVLRAEAIDSDVRSAIDRTKDILRREMESYKEKNAWKSL
ncbi:MAG: ribosome-associated translation inhibitor RaiA [Candidatus Wildermuthbacteria bacterium]|nr:ribosome-associated translation inhibitor RaiA [Candidatus Wildermuthbacteria bacterium]